jgi:hypothetical protein
MPLVIPSELSGAARGGAGEVGRRDQSERPDHLLFGADAAASVGLHGSPKAAIDRMARLTFLTHKARPARQAGAEAVGVVPPEPAAQHAAGATRTFSAEVPRQHAQQELRDGAPRAARAARRGGRGEDSGTLVLRLPTARRWTLDAGGLIGISRAARYRRRGGAHGPTGAACACRTAPAPSSCVPPRGTSARASVRQPARPRRRRPALSGAAGPGLRPASGSPRRSAPTSCWAVPRTRAW